MLNIYYLLPIIILKILLSRPLGHIRLSYHICTKCHNFISHIIMRHIITFYWVYDALYYTCILIQILILLLLLLAYELAQNSCNLLHLTVIVHDSNCIDSFIRKIHVKMRYYSTRWFEISKVNVSLCHLVTILNFGKPIVQHWRQKMPRWLFGNFSW